MIYDTFKQEVIFFCIQKTQYVVNLDSFIYPFLSVNLFHRSFNTYNDELEMKLLVMKRKKV